MMTTKYLIGRGELLAFPIDHPKKKPGDPSPVYTLDMAKDFLIPAISSTSASFSHLPKQACPSNIAVAKFTLHPKYLAKSYFPSDFLRAANLISIGSRTVRVKPKLD